MILYGLKKRLGEYEPEPVPPMPFKQLDKKLLDEIIDNAV